MSKLYELIQKQIEIMAALRTPIIGCPWDLEQSFDTIAPYTIEEAYEVADAINRKDFSDLKEELGDLFFQIAFHSRMAEEAELFKFEDVVETLNNKMIARHPHVFKTDTELGSAFEVLQNWEKLKAQEREAKNSSDKSILSGIANNLPALTRAEKISKRAARVGFDWENTKQIFDKLNEEINETKEAIDSNDKNHIEEEIGDMLFVLVNLARKLSIDPEKSLRNANLKFEKRFRFIETELAKIDKTPETSDIEEMESLWLKAKISERGIV